jgi:hypothetical protein
MGAIRLERVAVRTVCLELMLAVVVDVVVVVVVMVVA